MTGKRPSEREIEQSILYWLNYQPGCFAFKLPIQGTWNVKGKFFQIPGRFVPRGGSDIIGVIDRVKVDEKGVLIQKPYGQFFALEVKTPEGYRKFFRSPGDHEKRQQAFIDQIRAKGGIAEVVCSLDQVIALFQKVI